MFDGTVTGREGAAETSNNGSDAAQGGIDELDTAGEDPDKVGIAGLTEAKGDANADEGDADEGDADEGDADEGEDSYD